MDQQPHSQSNAPHSGEGDLPSAYSRPNGRSGPHEAPIERAVVAAGRNYVKVRMGADSAPLPPKDLENYLSDFDETNTIRPAITTSPYATKK